jgi:hypothetical protein
MRFRLREVKKYARLFTIFFGICMCPILTFYAHFPGRLRLRLIHFLICRLEIKIPSALIAILILISKQFTNVHLTEWLNLAIQKIEQTLIGIPTGRVSPANFGYFYF